jgi:hypothetical protein
MCKNRREEQRTKCPYKSTGKRKTTSQLVEKKRKKSKQLIKLATAQPQQVFHNIGMGYNYTHINLKTGAIKENPI